MIASATRAIHPEFDFVLRYGPEHILLTPIQASRCLRPLPERDAETGRAGRPRIDFVHDLIAEGKLEVFAHPERQVSHPAITRRSVQMTLAEFAQFEAEEIVPRLAAVIATLTSAQRERLLGLVSHEGTKARSTHK